MPVVISHGEMLIDFVSTVNGVSLIEAPSFLKAPGGAPANVAVGLARLGVSTGFLGQVGDDAFGHFLEQTLRENNVDVSALRFSREARTMLAFVSLRVDGERDFMFYRHPSADMLYRPGGCRRSVCPIGRGVPLRHDQFDPRTGAQCRTARGEDRARSGTAHLVRSQSAAEPVARCEKRRVTRCGSGWLAGPCDQSQRRGTGVPGPNG